MKLPAEQIEELRNYIRNNERSLGQVTSNVLQHARQKDLANDILDWCRESSTAYVEKSRQLAAQRAEQSRQEADELARRQNEEQIRFLEGAEQRWKERQLTSVSSDVSAHTRGQSLANDVLEWCHESSGAAYADKSRQLAAQRSELEVGQIKPRVEQAHQGLHELARKRSEEQIRSLEAVEQRWIEHQNKVAQQSGKDENKEESKPFDELHATPSSKLVTKTSDITKRTDSPHDHQAASKPSWIVSIVIVLFIGAGIELKTGQSAGSMLGNADAITMTIISCIVIHVIRIVVRWWIKPFI